MNKPIEFGGLMVVTDRVAPTQAPKPRELLEVLPLIIPVLQTEGDSIQVRDKEATDKELAALGRKIIDMAEGVPVIVNDRPEVALDIGAQGVHLGQSDLLRTTDNQLQRISDAGVILGISASTTDEAIQAEKTGADYIGFGPVYRTRSKQDAEDPTYVRGLRAASSEVSLPIIAIGGIGRRNAERVMRNRASGIAVISDIFRAKDPAGAANQLARIANRR